MNKIISEWLIMENKINIYIFFRILNLKCVMFIYYFDSYIIIYWLCQLKVDFMIVLVLFLFWLVIGSSW